MGGIKEWKCDAPRITGGESGQTSKRQRTSWARESQGTSDTVQAIVQVATLPVATEIDDVLETNAEDFVKSYVQKGGQ